VILLLTSKRLVTSLLTIVPKTPMRGSSATSKGDSSHSGVCCGGEWSRRERVVLVRGDGNRFRRERASRIPEWLCRSESVGR